MNSISELLEAFGIDSVELIRNNMANAGQNASGKTSRAIEWKSPEPNKLIVDGPKFVYVLETGRKPGKRPPVSPIKEWLEAKSIPVSGSIDSAAWAISTAIGKKGTKLFQDGGRTDIITPAQAPARFDKLESDIADIALNLTVQKIEEVI
jgi:hypothetical protein